MTTGPARPVSVPRRSAVGALLGVLGFAVAFLLGQSGVTRVGDLPFYDVCVRHLPDATPDPRVARVYVGDRDIARFRDVLGRWPWTSRSAHAQALAVLRESGAAAVGYDIFFTERTLTDESDDELAVEMADFEHVVLGMLFQTDGGERWAEEAPSETAARVLAANTSRFGTSPRETGAPEGRSPALPIDVLADAAPTLGHCNPLPDPDRAVRRAPLFVRNGDGFVPSLALRLAMTALRIGPADVVFDPARREVRMVLPGGETERVPVDPDGAMWVRYDTPLDAIQGFQYGDLDRPEVRERLRGTMVVLGVSITGSSDLWRTPRAEAYPGFLIHAQVLENLLARRFVTAVLPDARPGGAPELAALAAMLVACAALGVLSARLQPAAGWSLTLAATLAPAAASWLLLDHAALWIPPTTATLGLGFAGLLGVGHHQWMEIRERRRVRRIYERYLAPAVLDRVLAAPDLMHLSGARKELTMFFSDIRAFTPYAETVEPEELTARLNEYYSAMIEIAHRHGATLDKLLGDGLMVFFGDPVPQEDHALRAVRMALEMRARMDEMAVEWRRVGRHVFEVGMGIATGHVAVGNLGSDTFVDYTVVGRVVNLAARLQSVAGPREILVSARTYELVRDHVIAENLGVREMKGISAAETVFRVDGLR